MSEDDKKLFVGGLPAQASEEDVRLYFAQFGTIEECSVKFDSESGRSRGFGFVTFTSSEGTNAVLAQNGHQIKGKLIDPKKAKPQGANSPNNKIFIGGIDKSSTEQDIRNACGARGEVSEVSVPKDPVSEQNKGFAFVTFTDSNLVSTLCSEGKIYIGDKECDIRPAKNKADVARGGFRGGRGGGRGRGGYGGGYDMYGGGGGGGFETGYPQYGQGGYGDAYAGYGGGGYGGGYDQSGWGGGYAGQDQYKMKSGRGGGGYQPY